VFLLLLLRDWPLFWLFGMEGLPLMIGLPADCFAGTSTFLCWRYLLYFCWRAMLHGGIAAVWIRLASSAVGWDAWWLGR